MYRIPDNHNQIKNAAVVMTKVNFDSHTHWLDRLIETSNMKNRIMKTETQSIKITII